MVLIQFSFKFQELTQTLIILFGTAIAIFWNFMSLSVWFHDKEFFNDLDSKKYLAESSFSFYGSLASDKDERNKAHSFFNNLDEKHPYFDNDFYKFFTLVGLAGEYFGWEKIEGY